MEELQGKTFYFDKVLWKTFYFDSAHRLPNYEGQCKNLHGHRWRLDVGVTGLVQTEGTCQGMIIDFVVLKKLMSSVIEKLDHRYLNDFISNPTAENIVDFLVAEVFKVLPENCYLFGLRLFETPESCIEWKAL